MMLWMIVASVRYLLSGSVDETELPLHKYGPYLWIAKLGLALCLIAWFWSLFSSLKILRQLRNTP